MQSADDRLADLDGVAGNLEFWPGNYGAPNSAEVEGASSTVWDWGDQAAPTDDGYGSMQIHVPARGTTIFAINHWSAGERADIGIGNSALDPRCTDWTFAANASSYTHKRLRIFVRKM